MSVYLARTVVLTTEMEDLEICAIVFYNCQYTVSNETSNNQSENILHIIFSFYFKYSISRTKGAKFQTKHFFIAFYKKLPKNKKLKRGGYYVWL